MPYQKFTNNTTIQPAYSTLKYDESNSSSSSSSSSNGSTPTNVTTTTTASNSENLSVDSLNGNVNLAYNNDTSLLKNNTNYYTNYQQPYQQTFNNVTSSSVNNLYFNPNLGESYAAYF
jgi:hypothetical protein